MNSSNDMMMSPEHQHVYEEDQPYYDDMSMMSPEYVHGHVPEHEPDYQEDTMDSPRAPTPWEKENSMLDCAMIMTRECERQRTTHFRGPTGSAIPYIFCCAYTAPTMTVAVMFLKHFGITNIAQLNAQLAQQQLLGQDKTPLTHESVCRGINEVMGNIWTHHSVHRVGIDMWLLSRDDVFETSLDPGVNMVSFVDDARDGPNKTVHHAFIYVSEVDRDTCYIVDSWCSEDLVTRDLVKRRFATAEVLAALHIINTGIDPYDIMLRVFLDPVTEGSCHSPLRVVKLKRQVVQGLINTTFPAGSKGSSRFGGKSKAASSKALRKSKALSKAASRKQKALRKALSRRKNKTRRLR
jgi:hypothetical protein